MGVRAWLWNVLAQGSDAERDPDERVELITIHLAMAPVTVENLLVHGIDAHWLPAFDVATRTSTKATVYVRRRDLAAAESIVDGSGAEA